MISDDDLPAILSSALSEALSGPCDPSVLALFRPPRDDEEAVGSIEFHHWITAAYAAMDEDSVREAALTVFGELVNTPIQIAAELLNDANKLLSALPLWEDGSPLHAELSRQSGEARFGVIGGNIVKATDRPARDLRRGIERLYELDREQTMESDEPLQVICHESLVGRLRRAARSHVRQFNIIASSQLACDGPWFLNRSRPVAAFKVSNPTLPAPDSKGRVLAGALFSVWLDDPSTSVRIGGYD